MAQVRVDILGDASSVQRAFGRAGAAGRGFQRQMTGVEKSAALATTATGKFGGVFGKLNVKGLAAGFAGGAGFVAANEAVGLLTETFKSAVEGASSLQKSGQAISIEFGTAGDAIKEFAEGDAAKLGISANAAEASAARFGALFQNLNIGKEQAAGMTVNMLKLAGSLASIRGVDAAPIIKNLSMALAGNTRSLKALGIVADSATIKQTALRMGLIRTGQRLTPTTRALAIYAIVTGHLAQRMSEAALHSGDLSSRQAQLNAQWSNAKDQLGAALIPALAGLTGALIVVLSVASKVVGAFGKLAGVKLPGGMSVKEAIAWAAMPEIKGPIKAFKWAKGMFGGGKDKQPTAAQQAAAAAVFATGGMPPMPGWEAALASGGFSAANRPAKRTTGETELPRKLRIAALNAQMTKGVADDLKVAKQEEAFFRSQLEIADKGSKKYMTILSNLVQAHQSIESIQQGINDENARHAAAMKAKRDKEARAQAKAISDTAKAAAGLGKNLLAGLPFKLKKAGISGLFGKKGGKDDPTGSGLTSYVAASGRKLTEGLGLSRAQRVEMEQRFAQAGMHGGRVPTAGAALGQEVPSMAPTVVQIVIDKKVLGEAVIEYGRKRAKNTSAQTRGRHGGTNLGLT